VLDTAVAQPGDGAAVRTVDLELDQLVAVDPHGPGGVDLGGDAAGQLEDSVYATGVTVEVKNGAAQVPTGPGLGVDVDESVVRELAVDVLSEKRPGTGR
jgi:muconate cycloisomerase